ncbi:MAG: malto-oligosyltrehalose trehalohydrolase, partial [Cyanobacteria bacterium P01_H01_bin.121]
HNFPLRDYIIYELHVGTFTPAGTFEAVIPRLADLKDLGITAIELMPVAQFPGDRNWGYDGVYPYAVQHSYGGPNGLKKLVDACHQQGLAVILDVVYNHFGPEGNYAWAYGPYFTDRYKTPWGSALNFDDRHSDGARNLIMQNALYWLREYHIDALRLDAVHAIYDFGAKHLLAELKETVTHWAEHVGRDVYLIAESDLNDARLLNAAIAGGYDLDAQWSDDFHHSLHVLLTGDQRGYYQDFADFAQFVKVWRESFIYTWQYSAFRQRLHGNFAGHLPPSKFVVCIQNHDQVGNQMLGDRLSQLVSFAALKLAAGAVILSPYVPLLFMGEEYAETAPFLYFISHSDPELVDAVRQGRQREYADFHTLGDPPDAASLETFQRSLLNWEARQTGQQQLMRSFYKRLIELRKTLASINAPTRKGTSINSINDQQLLSVYREHDSDHTLLVMNFNSESACWDQVIPAGEWQLQLDSAAAEWTGAATQTTPEAPSILVADQPLSLPPQSFVLYSGNL